MAFPTKEGSDSIDDTLNNSKNESPNDCNADIEPSFADPNVISQVEINSINKEPSTSNSQKDTDPQTADNSQFETQKTQNDPQEDLIEDSCVIQIPIPRKMMFLVSGLGRNIYLSIPLLQMDRNNSLTDRSIFYPGKVVIKISDFCHSSLNCENPLQLSISRRIPFININEIRRMILCLLCARYFSRTAGLKYTMWMKQNITFLLHPNVLTHVERNITLGSPLRMYFYHPLNERMASGKFCKSTGGKEKDRLHIFAKPMFYILQAPIQGMFKRKAFENHSRSHHNRMVAIIRTKNGWEYLCPVCGCSFNNFIEFRQHCCMFPGN